MRNRQSKKSNLQIIKRISTVLLSLIVVFLMFGGEASSNSEQAGDQRGCENNFSYDGNFFSGRTFKTHQLIENVTVHDAVVRAARFISRDGYTINNIDKEIGIINATQGVKGAPSQGQRKTVPLNVTIDQINSGVDVHISFSISGGMTVDANGVKDNFCEIIEAIYK